MEARNSINEVMVLLPLPFGRGYTYGVPTNLNVVPGDIVTVPFGKREVIGVVWDRKPDLIPSVKLRLVKNKIDKFILPLASRRFVEWVSTYNMSSEGAVLKMAMSVADVFKDPKPITAYHLNKKLPMFRKTNARRRVVEALQMGETLTSSELISKLKISRAVIKGLLDSGVLIKVNLPTPSIFGIPDGRAVGPALSEEQARIASSLCGYVDAQAFQCIVLEGVPGAGKTEVYMEAICQTLFQGKQILVLLPEIALSAQWFDRFKRRFGCDPVPWHSDLTKTKRVLSWREVASGVANVVVGARSALFLPYPNLGLIIVDEEHDTSFKQEEGVIYNARDMAVVRARIGQIPIILTSATPSLETLLNVKKGRYKYYNLQKRHGNAAMPKISVVDMRTQDVKVGTWLSPAILEALSETFEAGEQAMLFLNRRGYAPLTLCRACGHRFRCKSCSTWLVEHRLIDRLQCHQCGYATAIPVDCPECSSSEKLAACGPGVERLAEEVLKLFPKISFKVVTSDTVHGPTDANNIIQQVDQRKIDLLIGTQIISKGYHFPYLTLVAVVDADLGLSGGDLRASERTFQLLYQVSGRSGRANHPGRVIIQTYMPDHPVIQAIGSGDKERFITEECRGREMAGMPPYGRLVGIVVSGKDEALVEKTTTSLNRSAPRGKDIQTLGPAEAPLRMLRGKYRKRFLLKALKYRNLQPMIRRWLSSTDIPRDVRVRVDIDPYNFL